MVGHDCQALFGRFGLREAAVSLGAGLLASVASIGAALWVSEFAPLSPNPVAQFGATLPLREFTRLLLILLPQLLGEELLTMLPFLAILAILLLTASHWGWGRRSSIALALLGSTLLFSAGHLPTYDWNWVQCFVVIGAARVVWTLAYIATRSLWVSIGAHILTDWVAFMLAFLAARLLPWAI
ncbi:MAG: CPBP family intramembrane glutamic endopeptidase [Comamonas sp.]|uniref:CPBP family intramembrane glutamic endopeptidase n=1 Tax=Comamonas sp. TaxID=34028 RepID=UPI002FC6E0C2